MWVPEKTQKKIIKFIKSKIYLEKHSRKIVLLFLLSSILKKFCNIARPFLLSNKNLSLKVLVDQNQKNNLGMFLQKLQMAQKFLGQNFTSKRYVYIISMWFNFVTRRGGYAFYKNIVFSNILLCFIRENEHLLCFLQGKNIFFFHFVFSLFFPFCFFSVFFSDLLLFFSIFFSKNKIKKKKKMKRKRKKNTTFSVIKHDKKNVFYLQKTKQMFIFLNKT